MGSGERRTHSKPHASRTRSSRDKVEAPDCPTVFLYVFEFLLPLLDVIIKDGREIRVKCGWHRETFALRHVSCRAAVVKNCIDFDPCFRFSHILLGSELIHGSCFCFLDADIRVLDNIMAVACFQELLPGSRTLCCHGCLFSNV